MKTIRSRALLCRHGFRLRAAIGKMERWEGNGWEIAVWSNDGTVQSCQAHPDGGGGTHRAHSLTTLVAFCLRRQFDHNDFRVLETRDRYLRKRVWLFLGHREVRFQASAESSFSTRNALDYEPVRPLVEHVLKHGEAFALADWVGERVVATHPGFVTVTDQ